MALKTLLKVARHNMARTLSYFIIFSIFVLKAGIFEVHADHTSMSTGVKCKCTLIKLIKVFLVPPAFFSN